MSALDPLRRKRLIDEVIARASQQGEPFATPDLISDRPPSLAPQEEPYGPQLPTPLQKLESQRTSLDKPVTKKQGLLAAISEAAPVALGGIFGGTEGAYGASQGVEQQMAAQQQQRTAKRKSLSEEIEAEKNRQERMGERQLTAQTAANTLQEQIRQHEQQTQLERDRIAAENQRAADVQAGQNQRLQTTIANRPVPNLDPNSPEVRAGRLQDAIDQAKQLSQIPNRPTVPQPQPAMSPERLAQEKDLISARGENKTTPTIAVKTTDPQGNPITQIVPKTPGTVLGGAPTAQEQNRRTQAAIIQREADRISAMIDRNPNVVGPVLGRIARGEAVLGTVSPEAKALGTALGSFEALQPILHGFRGGSQTVEHFHSVLGDQTLNAAALKAALAQIKTLAMDIQQGGEQGGGNAPNGPGTKINVIAPNGQRGSIPFEDWPEAQKQGYKRAQ